MRPYDIIRAHRTTANAPPARAAVSNFELGNKAAPLAKILTPTGIGLIKSLVQTQCVTPLLNTLFAKYTASKVVRPITTLPPAVQKGVNQADADLFTAASSVPLLLVHATADTFVPPSTTATIAATLCSLKPPQPLERWFYTGLDHHTIIGTAIPDTENANGNFGQSYSGSTTYDDMIRWLSNRFANVPWPDPYTPTGDGITPVTQTNSC